MAALVDLDGVLAENIWPNPGIGRPLDGAQEAVRQLRQEHGKKVVVYTARASYEVTAIWRWLFDNGIRVDDVKTGKESGHFYIGDEAIPFRANDGGWDRVLREAQKNFLGRR